MKKSRLRTALEGAEPALPTDGPVGVFGADAHHDLSPIGPDRAEVVQGFRPAHDHWMAQGYRVVTTPGGPYAAAVVFLPRAKAHARALIGEAARRTRGGPVIIDGQKTDGIDSIHKLLRARAAVSPPLSRAHGKLFWFPASGADLDDWQSGPGAADHAMPEGFMTVPGVFSADRVDPGSELLAAALPARLPARLADLGAGWGYLSRAVLTRQGVGELHLVEADHAALVCARRNIDDARARFHWADARLFRPERPLDMVVSNPPFHAGHRADPALGREFIAAAAEILKPSGNFWMVANRHLPYEAALRESFAKVEEIPGNNRYKLFVAGQPRRLPRRRR